MRNEVNRYFIHRSHYVHGSIEKNELKEIIFDSIGVYREDHDFDYFMGFGKDEINFLKCSYFDDEGPANGYNDKGNPVKGYHDYINVDIIKNRGYDRPIESDFNDDKNVLRLPVLDDLFEKPDCHIWHTISDARGVRTDGMVQEEYVYNIDTLLSDIWAALDGETVSITPALSKTPVLRMVMLESPYAGDTQKNVTYARACLRDSILRGEAPFASHLLYTQDGVLDDGVDDERVLGMQVGMEVARRCDATVVYTDLGISTGMRYGIKSAELAGREIEYRSLRK